jgi:hypothetical protein
VDPRIRRVRDADIEAVVELVHALAEYERLSDECVMTPAQLRAALFAPQPALFGHVAEVEGRVVGFTLWFLNWRTCSSTRTSAPRASDARC